MLFPAGEHHIRVIHEGFEDVEDGLSSVGSVYRQQVSLFYVLNVAKVEALVLVVGTELLIHRRQQHLAYLLIRTHVQKYFAQPEGSQLELVYEFGVDGTVVGLVEVQEVLVGEVVDRIELEHKYLDVSLGAGGGDAEVAGSEQNSTVHDYLNRPERESHLEGQVVRKTS